MELVVSGIAWSAGILIYGALTRGNIIEREWFAIMMINGFAILNGVIV